MTRATRTEERDDGNLARAVRERQGAGRPAPCRARTVRDRLPSYGSSVRVALVMGTMHHVVTMQVNQRQVHQTVVGTMAIPVMHL